MISASNSLRIAQVKIGAVSYLNTRPLIYGLAEHAPEHELILDAPSRLADDLQSGALDVALIPSIEYLRAHDYAIVSDACIACRGPVWSVKLFSRVPIKNIRTLALDEGSRTSAALVRILLKETHGLSPQIEPLPLNAPIESVTTDAMLLIGDRAMNAPPVRFADVWDLGEEWSRYCGLPFVFAMWTARPGIDCGAIAGTLAAARDRGLAHLAEIADREAAPLGLTRRECVSYFRDHLHFHLGPEELRGLELYYQLAAREGLAPAGVEIDIQHCSAAR